jgi:hypothetical protein
MARPATVDLMDENDDPTQPQSELPYDAWTEEALRLVAVRALQYAVQNGLPGEHHFYITFQTDQPGVVIPTRLLAKYPQEMTIVLQHQFWDLKVEPELGRFSVGLSFGGISSILVIPFAALTGFADPHVRFGLRFSSIAAAPPEAESEPEPEPPPAPPADSGPGEVVSLDQFRRRKD